MKKITMLAVAVMAVATMNAAPKNESNNAPEINNPELNDRHMKAISGMSTEDVKTLKDAGTEQESAKRAQNISKEDLSYVRLTHGTADMRKFRNHTAKGNKSLEF